MYGRSIEQWEKQVSEMRMPGCGGGRSMQALLDDTMAAALKIIPHPPITSGMTNALASEQYGNYERELLDLRLMLEGVRIEWINQRGKYYV